MQAQATGGSVGDHDPVLVLGRSRSHDLDMPRGQRTGQRGPDRRRIRHRDAGTDLQGAQRRPEILGNHVHQALLQCGLDEFAGAEVELEPHRDARVPDGQPVYRRQQLALREVEGGHHDRAGGPVRADRSRPVRTRMARGEQDQRADREGNRTSEPCCSPRGHDITFFVTSAVRR